MKHLALAAAAVLAIETEAFACSCIATDDPAELRRFAVEAAENAVALVEVEVVSPYDPATGKGEVLKVTRTLAGQASPTFHVPRAGPPFGASCDLELRAGQREMLILYPAPKSSRSPMPDYRISGLCTDHLLDKPVYRDAVIEVIGGGRRGERG